MAKDIPFHPAAAIFPMMEGKSLEDFKADIEEYGVREPAEVLNGKLIDGRNRYVVCLELGIKCPTVDVTVDDPVAYVLSKNLHRRHMTPSQLSMVGDKARAIYDKEAKERQKEHGGTAPGKITGGKVTISDFGKARDAVGKAVGVSGSLIDRAAKVREKGTPELAKAVEEGRMSVSTAAKLADENEETQKETALKAKFSSGRYRGPKCKNDEPEPGVFRGVGVLRANEAINALKQIPKNDLLRKRGFQIVTDWIKANK